MANGRKSPQELLDSIINKHIQKPEREYEIESIKRNVPNAEENKKQKELNEQELDEFRRRYNNS